MSVLGFDIRDYTDPQKILEDSLRQQPPLVLQSSGNGYQPPPPQPQPSVQAPVTVDNATGQPVTAPAGINPAATEQPPAVPIPGTAGPSGVSVSSPASISPMEGVTNQDRLNAMAMVLGAVGQNNFSQVLGAAQAGLMQKDKNAREHNQKLAGLTTPQLDYDPVTGLYDYEPPKWEIDSKGNYVPRSLADIEADYKKFYGDKKAPAAIGDTYEDEYGWQRRKSDNSLVNPDLYEPGHEISAEGRLSATRLLREEYKSDIKPIEDEINQIDLAATTAAEAYLDPKATDAQKTEADRSLIKLVEKLWDPTSAVLGGEFETAQAAQSWFDAQMRRLDVTSGETLGPDKRRALLDILYKVGEQKVGVYNERASDLSARAGSSLAPYRASQTAGVVDAALPRAWRTDAEGNLGDVGTYYDKTLDPAWQRLMESEWWGANKPTPETYIDSTAASILDAEPVRPSVLNPYGVRP